MYVVVIFRGIMIGVSNYYHLSFLCTSCITSGHTGCIAVFEKLKLQISELKNSYESNAKYKAVFGFNVAWFPVISFHQGLFTNWSLFLAWLVTNPKLYFPLGQDLSESCKKRLEGIVLWEGDVSTLGDGLTYPYDGVIKVELNVSYICLLSFFLLLLSLFFIISVETMRSTLSNCPNSVNVNILHTLVELCQ